MAETVIPQRISICRARMADPGYNHQHAPSPASVETESSIDLEWQFGTCGYCAEPISRFRFLHGGTWFDRWGSFSESEYVIPDGVG
jgi:hypothetical protein